VTAEGASPREPDPDIDEDTQSRRPGDSITDYRAAAFLFGLFFLAIGLMYLIGTGRG
jgi:hypothetical protein